MEQSTVDTTVTSVFTTFFGDEWKHTGKLYVRKAREKDRFSGNEKKLLRDQIPHIEERQKSEWLLSIMQYGPKPILLTYKASENTLAQSPLFGCVLAKETLHHTQTSADMKRIFDNPLDTKLRAAWKGKSNFCPVFIQMWEAYPQIYEDLKNRDGETLTLHYTNKQLHIKLHDREYVLDVETIKE